MSETPFQAPSLESIASLLPAFEFEQLIAVGGMGAVYKARQRSLDRAVAIKVLPRELGDDPKFRASFEEEAKVMARLTHPNLITVHDFGEVGGLPYIVMEYVDGESLFHSSHGMAVDPKQAVEIALGICRGLAEAHEHGIVHRDIKPANILLTRRREPKIGDFGLARAVGLDSDGLTMGTPDYTAPEVIHHPERADRRSDLYSVGVILRELLSGLPPEDDTAREIADPKLREICETATHPDASRRFRHASAMIAELRSWLRAHAASAEAPPAIAPAASHAFGRNFAIIAVLLAAIFVVWKLIERKPSAISAQHEEATRTIATPPPVAEPEPLPTDAPESPEPTAMAPAKETVQPPAIPEIVREEPAETPAQSLLRLREKLASGELGELPIGTRSWGDSHFFHVSRPTSWQSASRMARAYGGHLALVDDERLRAWLADMIPPDTGDDPDRRAVWIGATRGDSGAWQYVTGRAWKIESKPQGSGGLAALDRDGSLIAASADANHPFFIQWHRDGSNPTHIREILAASWISQRSDHPFSPPGTQTLGDRRFLIVEEPHSYSEALELAELGGGKLMSAATREEADWLGEAVNDINAADGLWLGATLQNRLWVWNDTQPWSFARWAPESDPGSGNALLILPDSGWAPADREKTASGFVIEWSEEPGSESARIPFVNLERMTRKAKTLLSGFDERRHKEAAENADEYLWKLDIWLRRRGNSTEIKAWTPRVQRVKAAVRDGRLPANIPKTPNRLYPEPLLETARYYLGKQQAIDRKFMTRAREIRDTYAARLEEEAAMARRLGQRESARMISEKLDHTRNLKAWVESLGFISG